jgi:hypothetical protein
MDFEDVRLMKREDVRTTRCGDTSLIYVSFLASLETTLFFTSGIPHHEFPDVSVAE